MLNKNLQSIGVIRKVDELGRVVLPISLRRSLHIEVGDSLEIFVTGDQIIFKKYEATDVFTGETEDLIEYNGKKISKNTIRELAKFLND